LESESSLPVSMTVVIAFEAFKFVRVSRSNSDYTSSNQDSQDEPWAKSLSASKLSRIEMRMFVENPVR